MSQCTKPEDNNNCPIRKNACSAIQNIKTRINALPEKTRQWMWFISLWLGGLLCVSALGYVIKFLMFIQL